jgi:hypothetical protein
MKTPPEIKPSQVTVGQIVEAEQKKPPNYRWVLLWQIPLRGLHWLTALSILTLGLTGLYIGRPYFMTAPAPTAGFMMGWMRFIHFTAAGLLVAVGMFRVYIWLYGGNKFERLPALIPHSVKEWRNLARQVKAYALVDLKHRPHYLGHNPLQQLAYTGVYVSRASPCTACTTPAGSSTTGSSGWGRCSVGGRSFASFTTWPPGGSPSSFRSTSTSRSVPTWSTVMGPCRPSSRVADT